MSSIEAPEGYALFTTYMPCHSTTPWDYYGMKHQQQVAAVLNHFGINVIQTSKNNDFKPSVGSGPGGRVRFGDGMRPATYYTFVRKSDIDKAVEVWEAHRAAVTKYLFHQGPKPATYDLY